MRYGNEPFATDVVAAIRPIQAAYSRDESQIYSAQRT